jgi:hypothetical protein
MLSVGTAVRRTGKDANPNRLSLIGRPKPKLDAPDGHAARGCIYAVRRDQPVGRGQCKRGAVACDNTKSPRQTLE